MAVDIVQILVTTAVSTAASVAVAGVVGFFTIKVTLAEMNARLKAVENTVSAGPTNYLTRMEFNARWEDITGRLKSMDTKLDKLVEHELGRG